MNGESQLLPGHRVFPHGHLLQFNHPVSRVLSSSSGHDNKPEMFGKLPLLTSGSLFLSLLLQQCGG